MIDPALAWLEKLQEALESARGAILLISKHFIGSDFIRDRELPQLIAAANRNTTKIFSIVLSPCRFDDLTELSKYQAVNSPSEPLEGMAKVEWERVFVDLTQAVETELLTGLAETTTPRVDQEAEPVDRQDLDVGTEKVGSGEILNPPVATTTQRSVGIASGIPDGWQRVIVRGKDEHGLQFLAIAEGHRVEAGIMPSQRLIAERLIEDAGRSVPEPQAGRALYELLIPLAFRGAFRGKGTVIVTDEHSDWLPIEMMYTTDGPLALSTPIVRQHFTSEFSPRKTADTLKALVIGDPLIERLPQLQGAAAEASAVAKTLTDSALFVQIRCSIRQSALNIISDLFAEEWQILHFAGHGVDDYGARAEDTLPSSKLPPWRLNGLVLSENVLFTAADSSSRSR